MTRVLHISPFAIPDEPMSGGLIRIAQTRLAYERAGCLVDPCHVITRRKDLHHALDLRLPWLDRVRRPHLGPPHHLGPIRQRWATLRSRRLLDELLDRLNGPIDLIHLEHPWAIELAQGVQTHPLGASAALVYGSHNIEHTLHQQICEQARCWNRAAKALQTQILDAEQTCAKRADLCWAVSASDAKVLQAMGARQIVLAPNGCRALPPRHADALTPKRPYALFVGGDYLPNVEGFLEWVGTDPDKLPSDGLVVVAGSAGDRLIQHPASAALRQSGRFLNVGKVPSAQLDQLILHAHALLLPISHGGGTNLKTAEALSSRRPVVATVPSMRGFEHWSDDAHVHVCSSPAAFRDRMRQLLQQPFCEDAARRNLAALSWSHTLDMAVARTLALTQH